MRALAGRSERAPRPTRRGDEMDRSEKISIRDAVDGANRRAFLVAFSPSAGGAAGTPRRGTPKARRCQGVSVFCRQHANIYQQSGCRAPGVRFFLMFMNSRRLRGKGPAATSPLISTPRAAGRLTSPRCGYTDSLEEWPSGWADHRRQTPGSRPRRPADGAYATGPRSRRPPPRCQAHNAEQQLN